MIITETGYGSNGWLARIMPTGPCCQYRFDRKFVRVWAKSRDECRYHDLASGISEAESVYRSNRTRRYYVIWPDGGVLRWTSAIERAEDWSGPVRAVVRYDADTIREVFYRLDDAVDPTQTWTVADLDESGYVSPVVSVAWSESGHVVITYDPMQGEDDPYHLPPGMVDEDRGE